MSKKRKTSLKNFRFTLTQAQWLESQSKSTGVSQTRIVIDALRDKYRSKGFPV